MSNEFPEPPYPFNTKHLYTIYPMLYKYFVLTGILWWIILFSFNVIQNTYVVCSYLLVSACQRVLMLLSEDLILALSSRW